jgi:hypothetical protein
MSLRTYFEAEAVDCLARLERLLEPGAPEPAREAVSREVRCLGGVARLAGEARVHEAASCIVRATRARGLEFGQGKEARDRLRATVEDLRVLIAGGPAEELDARFDSVTARWAARAGEGSGKPVASSPNGEFEPFAAREAAAIAATMDRAISAFLADPRNREGLGAILHRQRPLLGSARLAQVPIIGEVLQAVDDLSDVIVRIDVPVKREWLDVFRSARDALRAAAAALEQGRAPQPTRALSRLRTLREELLERFRAERAELAAADPSPNPGGEPADGAARSAAWRRALELRPAIQRAAASDTAAFSALDELYGLIRTLVE